MPGPWPLLNRTAVVETSALAAVVWLAKPVGRSLAELDKGQLARVGLRAAVDRVETLALGDVGAGVGRLVLPVVKVFFCFHLVSIHSETKSKFEQMALNGL